MTKSTSSMVGPAPPWPAPGAAPPAPPMPPMSGMPPGAPPAAPYSLVMMGLQTASTSLASSRCSSSCTSHASHVRHAARSTSGCPIQLGDDGVADSLRLLLLLIELLDLGELVGVQPLDGLVALVVDGLAVVVRDLVLHLLILDGGLHVEAVALQSILGGDPLLLLLVIGFELLGIVDHLLDFLLGQAALVVCDRDFVLLAGRLVRSGHIEDTVGVNIEGHFDLGNSSGGWRNSGQIELAKVVVVPGHGPLTLVHLDGDSRLVVGVGGEGLGLFS